MRYLLVVFVAVLLAAASLGTIDSPAEAADGGYASKCGGGEIFLHAEECDRAAESEALPEILESPDYIVRGYGGDDRIVYGSGGVIPIGDITGRAKTLLERDEIAYVHVRSARNNCYQCRIERA